MRATADSILSSTDFKAGEISLKAGEAISSGVYIAQREAPIDGMRRSFRVVAREVSEGLFAIEGRAGRIPSNPNGESSQLSETTLWSFSKLLDLHDAVQAVTDSEWACYGKGWIGYYTIEAEEPHSGTLEIDENFRFQQEPEPSASATYVAQLAALIPEARPAPR